MPSRESLQESLLDRLDPIRQVEKLSDYFLRRKRLADLRGNYMYFYTDLPKPFDKKGLVGVNVHTGRDSRFILVSEPDARFTTDETIGLLYSADGNRLQAFDDPEVEFAAIDVHVGDCHANVITKAVLVPGAEADEAVRLALEAVVIVVERVDVDQTFGGQFDALSE